MIWRLHLNAQRGRISLPYSRFLDHIRHHKEAWKICEQVNVTGRANVQTQAFPNGTWQKGGFDAGGFAKTDPGTAWFEGSSGF